MSKKSKRLKKEFRERGKRMMRDDFSFETYVEQANAEIRRTHESSSNYEDRPHPASRTYEKRERTPIVVSNIEKGEKNQYTLALNYTTKRIPTTTEFVSDTTARIIAYTSGDAKRAIYVNNVEGSDVQALIPVAVKNLIVEADKETNTVVIYKVSYIDHKTKTASLYEYNKCVDGEWEKDPFPSIEEVAEFCLSKFNDGATFFSTAKERVKKEETTENAVEVTEEETTTSAEVTEESESEPIEAAVEETEVTE